MENARRCVISAEANERQGSALDTRFALLKSRKLFTIVVYRLRDQTVVQ
jgi:hypothetical protein